MIVPSLILTPEAGFLYTPVHLKQAYIISSIRQSVAGNKPHGDSKTLMSRIWAVFAVLEGLMSLRRPVMMR